MGKQNILYSQSSKQNVIQCHMEEIPGWSGAKRGRNEGRGIAHHWWKFKGKARQQGKGLASFNNISRL